jgi:uncharacterized protein DUF3108
MLKFGRPKLRIALAVCLTQAASPPGKTQTSGVPPLKFPYAESLEYRVGWRMVTAGAVKLRLTQTATNGWQLNLDLASEGFVNQLYHVLDSYKLSTNDKFCASSVDLDAQEGKHHSITTMAFDSEKHKLLASSKDIAANVTHKTELDIPPCTYEIAGAMMTLRASELQPGMKFSLPVTNGKKLANVRAEGLGKEKLTIKGTNYNTIRYETFVFDNVLYHRKGRLLIWITDDPQRLPVQMRFLFGFPLGDITLDLEKVEKL